MGEIPRDIEMTAFKIADGWSRDDVERADMQADIQRALLSERERCAKIAERYTTRLDVAAAIRQEEGNGERLSTNRSSD